MPTTAELLVRARACHRAGDLRQAEQLYRQVLQPDGANSEVWCLLGAVLQAQGRAAEVVAVLQTPSRRWPDAVDMQILLGNALSELGRPAEATPHYRHVLRLRPDHAETLTQLGVALAQQGQLDEAITHLRQAITVRPDQAQAHHNLGVALAQQGKPTEAVQCLEQALRVRPEYPEALYNLGNILRDLGRRPEAIARYREALRLKPDYATVYNNLGLSLTETRQCGEAVILLQQAGRLQPRLKEAHNNLGLAYTDLGRFADAEASFHEALRLDPNYAEAHNNLGSAYKEQDRLDEALACYQIALWLDPRSASVQYNRSLALLKKGAYEQGWPAYEWRWRRPQMPPRPFRQPRWDGAPLAGRTVLLYMEQGLGDMIQFIRYAPLVKERGGTVIVECPAFLLPLFSTCAGIDRLVAEGEPLPSFEVQAPLLSLPGLVGTTLATIPGNVPYFHPDPERVTAWQQRLGAEQLMKVGIVWQGNPRHQWDHHRSLPLACFAPLARVDGVRLYSLQKGPGTEQLQAVQGHFPVTELTDNVDAPGSTFLDTPALMQTLDLVITVDTALAHLAGALGVPVWVALSRVADWRWLCDREDTPWYPTMRLFRQERLGDWRPVMERMAAALGQAALHRPPVPR